MQMVPTVATITQQHGVSHGWGATNFTRQIRWYSKCIRDKVGDVARRTQLHAHTNGPAICSFQLQHSLWADVSYSKDGARRLDIHGVDGAMRDINIVSNAEPMTARRQISLPDLPKPNSLLELCHGGTFKSHWHSIPQNRSTLRDEIIHRVKVLDVHCLPI